MEIVNIFRKNGLYLNYIYYFLIRKKTYENVVYIKKGNIVGGKGNTSKYANLQFCLEFRQDVIADVF